MGFKGMLRDDCAAERSNQTLLYLGLAQTSFHQNKLFKIARKIEPESL